MVIRIVASFLVIFGIGTILVSDKTLARSGGGFAPGRAATSPVAIHPAGPPSFIHPGVGALGRGATLRSHAARTRFFRHNGAGFFDGAWIWPSYDPYSYGSSGSYAPSLEPDRVTPYEPPSPSFPAMGYRTPYSAPTSVYVIPYRPGCDSQTQTLPGKDGEERAITIVRC
jgi:hypothetical protein